MAQERNEITILIFSLFSAIVALFAVIALAGCDDIGPEQRDFGMMETDQGQALCPESLPWEVVCDGSCDDVEGDWFNDQIAWWNERLPGSFVSLGLDNDVFKDRADNDVYGTVFVSIRTPISDLYWDGSFSTVTDGEAGVTLLEWTENGEILRAFIDISHEYAYDENTVRMTLRHELGHTLGFADDMGPPGTVDLQSIMGDPTPDDGDLLDSDRDLYLTTCNP